MRAANPGVVLGLHRSDHERHTLEVAHDLGIRALDTSYSYFHFRSHLMLRKLAGTLLGGFRISTKVGYFPKDTGGPAGHDLSPSRLRSAVEVSARDLGRAPELVFLHNPEHSLRGLPPDVGHRRLTDACAVLQESAEAGLCGSWGVSTWDPRPLVGVLTGASPGNVPTPSVLMIRAGLLVSAGFLSAGESVADWFKVPVESRWGMSPFGGSTDDPVWQQVACRMFVLDRPDCTWEQAAFRAAGELPKVGQLAVGTNNTDHLRDLVAAAELVPDGRAITEYRHLLDIWHESQRKNAPPD